MIVQSDKHLLLDFVTVVDNEAQLITEGLSAKEQATEDRGGIWIGDGYEAKSRREADGLAASSPLTSAEACCAAAASLSSRRRSSSRRSTSTIWARSSSSLAEGAVGATVATSGADRRVGGVRRAINVEMRDTPSVAATQRSSHEHSRPPRKPMQAIK